MGFHMNNKGCIIRNFIEIYKKRWIKNVLAGNYAKVACNNFKYKYKNRVTRCHAPRIHKNHADSPLRPIKVTDFPISKHIGLQNTTFPDMAAIWTL